MPHGVALKVEVRQPRNGKFHRLSWALFTLAAEAMNDGPAPSVKEWTAEDVCELVKIATGHVDRLKLPKKAAGRYGCEYALRPKSISYAAMDNEAFSRFMDAAMIYIRDELTPWISDSDHWPEIEKILADSRLENAA